MIRLGKLFGYNRLVPYCGECRMSLERMDTYCDCGKYNKELQELYDKDPEVYRECFVK